MESHADWIALREDVRLGIDRKVEFVPQCTDVRAMSVKWNKAEREIRIVNAEAFQQGNYKL